MGVNMNEDEMQKLNLAEFNSFSWKFEEYEQALKIESFRDNVSAFVEPSSLCEKYTYAGGSARYMFRMKIERIANEIRKNIEKVPNASAMNRRLSNTAVITTICAAR